MPFKRALTYSLAINLFFLALCLIFGDLKFGAIDDYFMAARLTGALGTDYNPHLIFVNALYGYALLPLYHLFPKIGWYYIGEMFAVFLSFTVIGYVLLQRCGERWGAILATLFTALFASDFYLVVQFTQCASILSAAGMLLFAYGVVEKRATAPFVLGIILMLWGSVMRWQAFLMGMPFFCLGMLFIFKDCWKVKWRVIAGLAILFVGAFSMHSWDQKIYQTPEYADFVKFQGPRVTFGDNGNYNQNAVYEDAEELGLSAESAKLLYTGKIDSGILNLLLENQKFVHLIRLLALYKDETMLDGIRAANQNYTFLRSLLMGQARFHPEDAATATDLAQKISDLKTPPVSADTDAIRTVFMQIVADIKASAAAESKKYQAATAEILEDFRNTLTKGEEGFDLKSLTVDDMVQAIMHYARQGNFPPDTLSNLEETLTELFESAKEPGNDE